MTLLQRSLEAIGAKAPGRSVPQMASSGGLVGMSQSSGSQRDLTRQLGSMGNVGWLFAVVSRISTAVASAEWHLYQETGGERTEIEEHPLLDLWRSVNPHYTQGEFIETFQQHLDLTGEAWWILVRQGLQPPTEMWIVRPDRMTPVPDRDGYIKGYIYRLGSEKIPYLPEEVVFLRMPHPTDPYRGMGPVQSILMDIDSEQLAVQWTRNFFRNSAEPGGIIEFAAELDDAEFEKLRMRWQRQHQGVANAHRVAILEGGVWKDRKYTQREMEFSALRKLSRDTILGAFGMPGSVMGITESVNRSNAETGDVMFARWLVRPRLERIKQTLNERLAPMFGEGLVFDYDDPVPENRALNLDEAERGYKAGLLTRNEARSRLGEPEADDGGDEFVSLASPPPPLSLIAPSPVRRSLIAPVVYKADEDSLWPEPVRAERRKMATAWADRLQAEADDLSAYIADLFPEQRLAPEEIGGYVWDWNDKYGQAIEAELARAFSAAVTAQFPGMGPGEVQLLASTWARESGATLITRTEDFTKLRVNLAVEQTISNGEGLGQLQKRLREDLAFSRERAAGIARTETANALGQGTKTAARAQGRNEKHWVTQADALVSDICLANAADGWIPANSTFSQGQDTIPGHPNCRCNVRYRTSHPMSESYETRCPKCGKRLPVNNAQPGNELYCLRCKHEWAIPVRVDRSA